jgi:hypothetical protein
MGMYGSGGDAANSAAQQAQRSEDEHQARIKAATSTIDNIFADPSRAALYDTQRDAVYDLNKQELDRQQQEAERRIKFGLARNGLSGGSVDVDQHAKLGQRTTEGLMRVRGLADDAASELRLNDERTKQNLISMAQSGIDTGTAANMAVQGMNANAQTGLASRQIANIGNLFSDLGAAYMASQQRDGLATPAAIGAQTYGVSKPQQTYSGQTYGG